MVSFSLWDRFYIIIFINSIFTRLLAGTSDGQLCLLDSEEPKGARRSIADDARNVEIGDREDLVQLDAIEDTPAEQVPLLMWMVRDECSAHLHVLHGQNRTDRQIWTDR